MAIAVRLTEVEAYGGSDDPGSHAFRGRTERNATMFGPPGHLYCYLSYGMHRLLNIVCQEPGDPAAVLLRAGEMVEGVDAAAHRRGVRGPLSRIARRDLARGPGRLGQALGLRHPLHDGIDIVSGAEHNGAVARLTWGAPVADVSAGPRVGVAGVAGTMAFPWRFWITGDPTVSPFRWGRGAREAAEGR